MTARRRPKGTGGLTEIRPGMWRIRAYIGVDPLTGRGRHKERTVRGNRKQAEEALRLLRNEVADGTHTGARATLSTLAVEWLAQLERLGRRPATLATYRTVLAAHIAPALGGTQIGKIDAHTLDRYYAAKHGTLANTTIQLHHAMLTGMLQQAVDWGWLAVNPARSARPPGRSRTMKAALDPGDIRRLLEGCADDIDLATVVALGATTGARRGELCGLQWHDVDWDEGVLTIRRQRVPLPAGDITGPLKSGGARRVAIGANLRAVLAGWRAAVVARAEAFGVDPDWGSPTPVGPYDDHGGWLLSRDCGRTPWRPKSVTYEIGALGRRCGVPVTPHVFRHTAASVMAAEGVDAATAAQRLGHTPEVMLRIYTHALPGLTRDRAAADRLEAGFLALVALEPGTPPGTDP